MPCITLNPLVLVHSDAKSLNTESIITAFAKDTILGLLSVGHVHAVGQ